MYVKTIEYINFDAEIASEVLYFDLSPEEAAEIDARWGGLEALHAEVSAMDETNLDPEVRNKLFKAMSDLITTAYGERMKDSQGRDIFKKSPEIAAEFKDRFAYRALMVEFMEDPDAIDEFMRNAAPMTRGK